ncbi:hypothetical protein U942_01789 [Staphylococcus aureus Sau 194]|nr:hypothetical protein U942_01789 [Staphylococcus aureus Sau 194]
MDRLKYSLKVGILALLLFCTLNYGSIINWTDDKIHQSNFYVFE